MNEREDRREQLLRAARTVFAEHGYDKATVGTIVRAAGVAQGTFYLYFPSKLSVVVALGGRYLTQVGEAVAGAYRAGKPFEESLEPMVSAAFEVCRDNRDLARLVRFTLESELPEAVAIARVREEIIELIAGILTDRIAAGEVLDVDPRALARLVYGLVRDACHEAFVFGDGRDAALLLEATVRLLRDGLIRVS